MMTLEQNKKMHPYKFTMWIAIASIVMMFAGFTSAYIVKRAQVNWQGFDLPMIFTYSTIILIASSITMQLAVRKFKDRHMSVYRQLMVVTAILGAIFIVMQIVGFATLQDRGIKLVGPGSNVAGSFIAVIAGVHLLHVVGGIVTLTVMLYKAYKSRVRNYSTVGVEVASTYWHFVDILWIYLFVFLTVVS